MRHRSIRRGPIPPRRAGLARADLLALLAAAIVFAACVLPALARGKGDAHVAQSLANLALLGAAHAVYAADWNDRQPTFIQDDMAEWGNSVGEAFDSWTEANGGYGNPDALHPPITMGWGPLGGNGQIVLFAYLCNGNTSNAAITVPINFGQSAPMHHYGSFRFPNCRGLREYVASRCYAPVFHAPGHEVARPWIEPFFDEPWEYVASPPIPGLGSAPYWSSYCWSPAGMFDPDVMRRPQRGGWQDPWSIDHGLRSPAFSAARYPALKTLMLEHDWIQDPPAWLCNAAFPYGRYGGCEPFYFNHGLDSRPATLFHDLSTELLPNSLVQAQDEALWVRSGHRLWSRDTPFGASGYWINAGLETANLSHHVLTTDGILGRDRLGR